MAAPARYTQTCFATPNCYRIDYRHEKPGNALGEVSKIEQVINLNFKYIGQDQYAVLTQGQLWAILAGKAQAIRDGYAGKAFADTKVVKKLDAKLIAIGGHIQRYRAKREGMAILNLILTPALMGVVFEYLPYANHLKVADFMYREQGESGRAHLAQTRRMAAQKMGYRGEDAEAFIKGLDEDVRAARKKGGFRGLNLQPTDGGSEFPETLMALRPEFVGCYLLEFTCYPTLFQWLRSNFAIPRGEGPPVEDNRLQFRFGDNILKLRPPMTRRRRQTMDGIHREYITYGACVETIVAPRSPVSTAGQHGSKETAAPQGT